MSRADYERRKRSAVCPECGKKFSAQGLNGHLRFVHGAKGVDVKTKAKVQRVGSISARAEQTMQFASQLKQLRDQRRELEANDEGGLFTTDKATKAAVAAIARSERELTNELRKLAGQPPLNADGDEPDEDEESDDDDEDDDED